MTAKQQIEKGAKADRLTVLAVLEETRTVMQQTEMTLDELIEVFRVSDSQPKIVKK